MTKRKHILGKVCQFIENKICMYALRPFIQYFVEVSFAVITALSLLGYEATSLAHLYLGSFSYSSLLILLSSVRLDAKQCCIAIFRSPEMFNRVQVQVLAGPLKDIHWLVPKPLLHRLGCVLRVIVLLEAEPLPQSGVLSTLQLDFMKDLSVLCSIHLSLNSD